jgi:AcrR family transcriptional regulator
MPKSHLESEPGARFQRLPRPVRERQILDAAVEVFARRGYRLSSMDEIADVAGISKPMIYAYLGAKDELFAACIAREGERLTTSVSAAVGAPAAPDIQLWRWLQAFFGYVDENRGGWLVVYRQARSEAAAFARQVAHIRAGIDEIVVGLLARALAAQAVPPPQVDLAATAHALVGAAASLADWMVDHPDQTPTTTATRLMNLAWIGFGGLLRGAGWQRPPDEGNMVHGHQG